MKKILATKALRHKDFLGGDGFTDEVYLTDYTDFADVFGRSLLLLGTKTIGSMS